MSRGLFLALTITAILLTGCDLLEEGVDGKPVPADKALQESRQGIESITCFGCHPYDRFREGFPHDLHSGMGLHCNQCHMIKSHEEISIKGEACKDCHNLSVMKLETSAMPVRFNHESHGAMFGCGDCHAGLFPMKLNKEKILMDHLYGGNYCGRCHNGEMAFSSTECDRCHKG